MSLVLEGNSNYVIFFDNQHVQRFVKGFNVDIGVNGQPAQATIQMIYSEAFMEIDYLTDVKIFIKNVFNNKYRMVFDGQLHSRNLSINGGSKTITFVAYDNLYWLQKIPVPILFDSTGRINPLTTFTWLAKGINYEQVDQVLTAGQTVLAGMNLTDIIRTLFEKVNNAVNIHAGETGPDNNSIYNWVNLKDKIKVVSDFSPNIRQNDVIDIAYQGAIVENMFVFISGIVKQFGHEMYQDIDGLIKIKEPYWEEGILKPYVIDPIITSAFNEATDWDGRCTRVLVTGGVEHVLTRNMDSQEELDQFTPAVVYIGGDTSGGAAGSTFTTNEVFNPEIRSEDLAFKPSATNTPISGSYASRSGIAAKALSSEVQGSPYALGGSYPWDPKPSAANHAGIDCSGLVYWCYNQAGFAIGRSSSMGYYNQCIKIDVSQLQIGDLGFYNFKSDGPHHIGIYCGMENGKHIWVHASSSKGKVVKELSDTAKSWWVAFGDLVSAIKGGYIGVGALSPPTSISYKSMSYLTDLERRYGINVIETDQPLIRVGTYTDSSTQAQAFDQLRKYSKYLYHTINSSVSSGTMDLVVATPWVRPGFNIWFDPNGLSRVYYVNMVRHSGDPDSAYTSLGLVYGRSEKEYATGFNGRTDPLNPLLLNNNVKVNDYADYVVWPGNMELFKEFSSRIKSSCENKGSMPAYNSPFRSWYGEDFIRKNVDFLNRWDTEYNLLEIYCIINAGYKTSDGMKTLQDISWYASAPETGVINPLDRSSRVISSFAKKVIAYDLYTVSTPAVVGERVLKLHNIIKQAEKEIETRHSDQLTHYDKSSFR